MPHEKTAFENFRTLAKEVLAVPKKALVRREATYRDRKKSKRAKTN